MTRTETILVIEDERALREGLALNFGLQGYQVMTAADGEEGLALALDARVDLIVLDLMLPALGGLEILETLRDAQVDTPVLILSARDRLRDKLEGLGLGADDYVTKPFELAELLARVDAMLRRQRVRRTHLPPLTFGEVHIDRSTRVVTKASVVVALSHKEFDLLVILARAPGIPLSREQILDKVWGFDFEGTTRTVDNFIMSLRRKLEDDPSEPRFIKTVRQVGYKLEAAPPEGGAPADP